MALFKGQKPTAARVRARIAELEARAAELEEIKAAQAQALAEAVALGDLEAEKAARVNVKEAREALEELPRSLEILRDELATLDSAEIEERRKAYAERVEAVAPKLEAAAAKLAEALGAYLRTTDAAAQALADVPGADYAKLWEMLATREGVLCHDLHAIKATAETTGAAIGDRLRGAVTSWANSASRGIAAADVARRRAE